jgi:hypothetical protein
MTNTQFIAILEKALAGMDKQSRDDILLEIKSHADESGNNDNALSEQFGAPEELAKQYLDGATIATPIASHATFWGKRLLLSIGVSTVFVITVTIVSVWYLSQDDFDFANEQSPQLKIESTDWTTKKMPQLFKVNLEQSQASIYWHNEDKISWKCKGENPGINPTEGKLDIRHNDCLIFLPLQSVSIDIKQASVVIVRPQANVSLTLEQGSLRIAENDTEYRYEIKKNRSHSDGFKSNQSALVLIKIDAIESTIEHYQF